MSAKNRKAENKSHQIVVKNKFEILAKFEANYEVDKTDRLISTKVGDSRLTIAQGYKQIQKVVKKLS